MDIKKFQENKERERTIINCVNACYCKNDAIAFSLSWIIANLTVTFFFTHNLSKWPSTDQSLEFCQQPQWVRMKTSLCLISYQTNRPFLSGLGGWGDGSIWVCHGICTYLPQLQPICHDGSHSMPIILREIAVLSGELIGTSACQEVPGVSVDTKHIFIIYSD